MISWWGYLDFLNLGRVKLCWDLSATKDWPGLLSFCWAPGSAEYRPRDQKVFFLVSGQMQPPGSQYLIKIGLASLSKSSMGAGRGWALKIPIRCSLGLVPDWQMSLLDNGKNFFFFFVFFKSVFLLELFWPVVLLWICVIFRLFSSLNTSQVPNTIRLSPLEGRLISNLATLDTPTSIVRVSI